VEDSCTVLTMAAKHHTHAASSTALATSAKTLSTTMAHYGDASTQTAAVEQAYAKHASNNYLSPC
jgi:hypothetical protein